MVPQLVGVQTRAASPVSAARAKTRGRLYACDPILKRLPQDLHDMAAELRQFIQEEHAMVGQRHLARHGHVAATDQPRIRDGMMGSTTRSGRDQRRTVPREASDAVYPCGLKGFGEGHGRQSGAVVSTGVLSPGQALAERLMGV
jgi:hypothetical protein